jgi:hypothetical protein
MQFKKINTQEDTIEVKDRFQPLYNELLKKPQGDVIVARIKAFLAS